MDESADSIREYSIDRFHFASDTTCCCVPLGSDMITSSELVPVCRMQIALFHGRKEGETVRTRRMLNGTQKGETRLSAWNSWRHDRKNNEEMNK